MTKKKCKWCGRAFKPYNESRTLFCSVSCRIEESVDKEKNTKVIMRMMADGKSMEYISKKAKIPPFILSEVMDRITGEANKKHPHPQWFKWNRHLHVDEMNIMGKYALRKEWKLPPRPHNTDPCITVGDVKNLTIKQIKRKVG